MKKIIGLIISFIFISFSNLMADKTFIYIDVSNINRLDKVKEITKKIVDSIGYQDYIVYISNGENPIVIENQKRSRLKNSLKQLNSINPSQPNLNIEINSINKILTKKGWVREVNDENRVLNEEFNFVFISNLSEIIDYDLTTRFIDKLILSNRLLSKGKLIENSTLKVFADNQDSTVNIKSLKTTYQIRNYGIKEF